MISALMAEVAALRKTVAEKPENADLYQSNLNAAMETAKPFCGRRDADLRRDDRIGVQHGRVEELK
jgi:broad specificity phosphatase PhoE